MTDDPWFAVATNTACERRASQGIADAGFEVWYPTRLVPVKTRWMKRPVQREYPLYPGYLFAREARAVDWQGVYGIDGVRTVLLNHDRVLRIPDAIMQRIRFDAEIIAAEPPEHVLVVGDEVRITNGPFLGLTASVARIIGLSAVGVALDLFGRSTAVSVNRESLEKV